VSQVREGRNGPEGLLRSPHEAVLTLEEWAGRPRAERLARLERTAAELVAGIGDAGPDRLAQRPAPASWAGVEVVCHLRDVEESFRARFEQILAMPDPVFPRSNPDRWAEERQYLRHDAQAAARAFGRRRAETLALLRGVAADGWARAGVHSDSRGRRTLDEFVTVMAWHDENHLDQLRRALEGRA
jgi:DinB superfamily